MARFQSALHAAGFASGATRYADTFPGDTQDAERLVITARLIDTQLNLPFVVDTGAPWGVLDPDTVTALIEPHADEILRYRVRGRLYEGTLTRCRVALLDDQSDAALLLDATFFVPLLATGDVWREPNFIGLRGFLERIRFAIDPAENMFYFGSLGT